MREECTNKCLKQSFWAVFVTFYPPFALFSMHFLTIRPSTLFRISNSCKPFRRGVDKKLTVSKGGRVAKKVLSV